MTVIAYKFLRAGRIGPFSGIRWPDPGQDESWVPAGKRGPVSACRLEDLPEWPDDELWRVELDGDVRVEAGKLAGARGRLIERIDAWDAAVAAELAAACALRARDAAAALLASENAGALKRCATPAEVVAAADALDGLDESAADAIGYAVGSANAAIRALQQPQIAPGSAAAAAFIASHAAAHAAGDVEAARRERAWQAAWLAQRLALAPT